MIKEYTNPITGLKVYNKTLSNGLNIYLVESEIYYNKLDMCVNYGGGLKSMKTPKGEIIEIKPGTAHLIEHLAFYCKYKGSLITLEEYFDNFNIDTNAITNTCATNYHIVSDINLLKDEFAGKFIKSILNPLYKNNLIKNELEIISSEISIKESKEDEDTENKLKILYLLGDYLNIEADTAGDVTDLANITAKDLYKIQQNQYTPSNTTIVYYRFKLEDKNEYIKEIEYLEKAYMKALPRTIKANNNLIQDDIKLSSEKVNKFSEEEIFTIISESKTAYAISANYDFSESEKRMAITYLINEILFNKYILKDYKSLYEVENVNEMKSISIYNVVLDKNSSQIIEAEGFINKTSVKKYVEYVRSIEIADEDLLNAKKILLCSYIEMFDFELDSETLFLTAAKNSDNVFKQLEIFKDIELEEFIKEKNKILDLDRYIYVE